MAQGLITWTTNTAASSQVQYGPTTAYGSFSAYDSRRVTSHSVQLLGLTPGSTYHYRVLSRDTAGTLTTGTDQSFTYSTGYLPTVLQDSPLAYWRLDEASGTVAADTSGHGYSGTYTGGFTLGATGALTSDTDKAVTLNGTTGFVQVPYVPTFAHLPFSVEAWVKAATWPVGDTPIFTCGDANTTDVHLVLAIRNGSPILAFWNDDFTPTNVLSTGVYHHLVFVWEGPTTKIQRLYVDGVQVGAGRTAGADLAVTTGAITGPGGMIGQSVYNTAFWAGQLDEVAVYGTALSGTRVLAHYNASILASLASISPTTLTVGSGPTTITFTGSNTSWLTTIPTITVSSGSLGTLSATTNTSATATFTPPTTVGTITFTDTTDGGTTATLSITAVVALTGVSPSVLTVGGGAITVTFTGLNTTWLSVHVPTITVSAGSLGAITATSDTSAHAVFTPPLTAQNVLFTDTTDGSTTATIILSVTSPIVIPPQVPGMGPALVVEISFATNPTDPPQWVDVTKYVQGNLSINRGRQRELDQIQAGTCAFDLDNRDRRFDPTYTGSPYYPNVLPMRRVRVRSTYNNSNYPLFSGYIESWGQTWAGWQDAIVPVTAADAFKVLNLAQLNTTFPIKSSDQRVSDVLTAINWTVGGPQWILGTSHLGTDTVVGPVGDRVITAGSSTIQASTLANTSALQHLQDVTGTEMGLLYTDRDGAVTFKGRGGVVNKLSLGTFGEGTGELPYVSVELIYDDTNIWNDVEITPIGGTQQSAKDTTSQAQYCIRTLSITSSLANTNADAQALATALVGKYAQPSLQVSAMTLDGWANPASLFPQMLGREIGDLVTVNRRPPGGGQPISQPSIIQGIALQYAVTGGDWSVTWRLAPADTINYWVLGDPVLSILGSTTRLFF